VPIEKQIYAVTGIVFAGKSSTSSMWSQEVILSEIKI